MPFLDFEKTFDKAFDKIPYHKLIYKHYAIGIKNNLVQYDTDYLTDRFSFVEITRH